MSNYSSLKATINANVKANGNQEITGPVMNSVLNAMVDSLGAGYQYMGKAVPSTNPGTPDAKVFYLASDPGTYTNFNGLVVADGEVAFLKWDADWSKEVTGAATAAQLTQLGQEVDELKGNLDGGEIALSGWNDGEYITTNQAIGSVCPKAVTQNANWRSIIVAVTQNIVKFIVNGDGGAAPLLWCFLDTDDKVLSQSNTNVIGTGDALELVPPSNATQLIINSKNSEDCYKVVVGVLPVMQEELSNVEEDAASLNERTTKIEDDFSGIPHVDITDFSEYDSIGFYITTEGVWRSSSSPVSVLIPATQYRGKKISIVANETNNSLFAFLKGETITPVNGNPAPLCVGETGTYGITAGGNTSYFLVPNDCNWFCVATLVSGTDRTPKSIFIPGEDGMTDKVDSIAEQTENEFGLPISFDGNILSRTILKYGKIESTSSTGLAIYYKQFAEDTKLTITIKCFATAKNSRGRIGYVDSVSDIVVGNFVKSVISQELFYGDESTVEYFVPAGKVLVVYCGTTDILFAYPEKKIIRTTEKSKNIINGSYSWWTAPHTARKVLGNTDKTIVAYTKNTGELCVAIRDNNTLSYDEKVLMISGSIDDHNAPACSFLSDGRIIVTCALGHHDGPNQYIFISANPFDINSFVEKVFTTEGDCTYSRMIIHGGYIFLFWREEIEGVSYWHGVYSTDEFETNSGEFDFIRQSYVYLEKTTDPDYIKIYPCGHPTENAVKLNAIRSGYIKLSTMEILKGDGVTKVADLGTFVDNTDFDIIIDATATSKNRMQDAAITPVGVDRFVYAKGNPSSTPYDAKYYYYNNGTNIEIAPTGEPFYTASKYVGGAIIARQNNDVLIVAREDNDIWKLERYHIKSGAVDSVSLLDYSDAYIMRPIESGGCQFIYQKGDYNPSSFMDFATNIIFKDIVS